jgi:hypothetical protein
MKEQGADRAAVIAESLVESLWQGYVVLTADVGGAAWTPDEGSTWNSLAGVTGYWAVAFADPQTGWMGRNGEILKISFP